MLMVTSVTSLDCEVNGMEERAPRPEHVLYDEIHASREFADLRKRYRSFAIPWTVAFLAWYMLYVVCSNWAPGLMNTYLVGNINVALVFGLLQFASTFLIAWLYARHADRELDPLAERLNSHYNTQADR
ncbi:MAG TPA: DUF485 domain-containing protein [Nocardioidaceae bacterium]|jgi:uncharacterized membrane protein (DUF485 family)|nr:DUF485 domain-containing protein [Nocardioidaceae bacterium]